MSLYEIIVLGTPTAEEVGGLESTIREMVAHFDLEPEVGLAIRTAETAAGRNTKAATAAAYFGGRPHADLEIVGKLVAASVPVIPTLAAGQSFGSDIPPVLRATNGLVRSPTDVRLVGLATALLEVAGLLRRQRRVFVSYRREESREAALQLHEHLGGHGLEVFLDTHSIRPGEAFQDELWHKLCDSDVVVMLDTQTYFESRWTRAEFSRALAMDIHMLRVIWPGHVPERMTDLAQSIYLDARDLGATGRMLSEERCDQIAHLVEELRSRSLASRYRSITGRLAADVERIGGRIEGIGAHRAVSIRLPDQRLLWAYPMVGVPTADLLQDVVDKARRAEHDGTPILVYDHIGIRDQWAGHLRWLDEQISAVRAVKVAEAAYVLADWEG